ncbi:hypothetical protein SAVIM40S_00985 [Streptomyces avidinii]
MAAKRVFSAATVTAEETSAPRSMLRTGISSVVSATGSADGDALAVPAMARVLRTPPATPARTASFEALRRGFRWLGM